MVQPERSVPAAFQGLSVPTLGPFTRAPHPHSPGWLQVGQQGKASLRATACVHSSHREGTNVTASVTSFVLTNPKTNARQSCHFSLVASTEDRQEPQAHKGALLLLLPGAGMGRWERTQGDVGENSLCQHHLELSNCWRHPRGTCRKAVPGRMLRAASGNAEVLAGSREAKVMPPEGALAENPPGVRCPPATGVSLSLYFVMAVA